MTDPSLQKMQTTPESNVQKMHIPAEWVEAGGRAAAVANNDDPDFLGYQQNKPNWQLWSPCIEAALIAVIPLIREDERERIKASGHVILPREATEGMVKAGTERALNTSISSQTGGWPAYINGQWHATIAAFEEGE